MQRFLAVFVFLAAWSSMALAEQPSGKIDATDARLGALNPEERALIAPYLSQGPVILTEFANRQTDLPAVIYATRVQAPAATVAAVIGDPSNYPSFMRALTAVQVRSANDQMVVFDWTWGVALFSLTGRNLMTSYPGDSAQGYRFDIRLMSGELGIGRVMWRVYPEGPSTSLIVFSSRLDMRNANYLTRQLTSAGSGMNRTINVAVGMVILLEAKAEAERRSGTYSADKFPTEPLRRPQVDMKALHRLLGRGDLVLMDLDGDTLQRVTVVGRSGASVERVRRVMLDPEEFGKSFLHGSRAEVLERTNDGVRFGWKIPIPLLQVGGEMILRPSPTVIAIDGISGTISKGQWRFDTHRYPDGEAGVIGWAVFDPADSPSLIRKLIAGNTQFSHGFVAATQLAVMRSLRTRARLLDR